LIFSLGRLLAHLASIGNALTKKFLEIRACPIDIPGCRIPWYAQREGLLSKSAAIFRNLDRDRESAWRREQKYDESQS
jgi:hypothetical protein